MYVCMYVCMYNYIGVCVYKLSSFILEFSNVLVRYLNYDCK